MRLGLGHGSIPSPEVGLDDDAPADGGGRRGKPGLVAAAVRAVLLVVPAELGPPGPLPAHRHGLLALSSVEAREAAQAPAAADVELLPRGRGQDGVVVAKMLQQGQLLEVYPPKTWELETRRRQIIAVENWLEMSSVTRLGSADPRGMTPSNDLGQCSSRRCFSARKAAS